MKVVPWDHDITKESYDGLFISNGPGDPSLATDAINNLRSVSNLSPYTQHRSLNIFLVNSCLL